MDNYVSPDIVIIDIALEQDLLKGGSCGCGHSWNGNGYGHENHFGPGDCD